MAHFRKATFLAIAPSLVSVLAYACLGGFSTSGCDAYHNEAERRAYKKQQDAIEKKLYPGAGAAGAGGANAYTYIGPGYNPQDPTLCPNNECLPDPGSRVVSAEECKQAEEGLEFLPLPIMDFEDDRSNGFDDRNKNRRMDVDENGIPLEASGLSERYGLVTYTYDDDTTNNIYPYGWEPPAIPDPFSRCERKDNHVFHIAGGPFLEWGGGLGRSLRCMNGDIAASSEAQSAIDTMRVKYGWGAQNDGSSEIYCPTGESTGAAKTIPAACNLPENHPSGVGKICPKRDREFKRTKTVDPPQDAALLGMAIDLSEWEGISFWARRGPNSQAGIRLLLGDKYTDDDISFLQYVRDPMGPRYCDRAFECRCKDQSKPCTALTAAEVDEYNTAMNAGSSGVDVNPPVAGDGVCWDRENDPPILEFRRLQYCGPTACNKATDSGKSLNVKYDPLTAGTQCMEFTQRGSITTDFCYDPKSKIPAQQQPVEASQACGDHWMKSVRLGLDWQFYTIPFTELLQQGWAKRSYKLDLTALTLARITWDRGHIDFYIDDVRVYRKKK